MGARKIVDESEIVHWFEEGRTYDWMVEQYRTKYNLEVVPSLFGNFRRRRGLARRITRNDDLIPWSVEREHRWAYPLAMLRVEGRRRAGRELRPRDAERLDAFLALLEEEDAVIHYDPDTAEGFFYVPREAGDTDIIRAPKVKTTLRRAAD
jgi:hypothetical protein